MSFFNGDLLYYSLQTYQEVWGHHSFLCKHTKNSGGTIHFFVYTPIILKATYNFNIKQVVALPVCVISKNGNTLEE
jgi:hypothetical protein